jgi:hypothetical protein
MKQLRFTLKNEAYAILALHAAILLIDLAVWLVLPLWK